MQFRYVHNLFYFKIWQKVSFRIEKTTTCQFYTVGKYSYWSTFLSKWVIFIPQTMKHVNSDWQSSAHWGLREQALHTRSTGSQSWHLVTGWLSTNNWFLDSPTGVMSVQRDTKYTRVIHLGVIGMLYFTTRCTLYIDAGKECTLTTCIWINTLNTNNINLSTFALLQLHPKFIPLRIIIYSIPVPGTVFNF